MNLYILRGGVPEICDDAIEWAIKFNDEHRHVAKQRVGNVLISTVFLGMDHSFGGGPPVLWETMIFGGEHDQYQERYSSLGDAKMGHARAVDLVKSSSADAPPPR